MDYGDRSDLTMLAIYNTATGEELELDGNSSDFRLVDRYVISSQCIRSDHTKIHGIFHVYACPAQTEG